MNGRLFIFGIGGTGARVIKALTMLLASGVKINAEKIIPIIIDPHQANKDLKRTITLLNNYQSIRNSLEQSKTGKYFATEITTLNKLVEDANLPNTFSFKLQGVEGKTFSDYINYNGLDRKNKALINMLFSTKNLNTDMDIGFIGNPNVGSVVLNQFKDSEEFKHFTSNFRENDRIFFISSIFGGTGAAGFPILMKNIRNAINLDEKEDKLSNTEFLQNAKIGAVTVLPYFSIQQDDDTTIDKSTFIAKTKAALKYYEKNITDNNSINALYYIGDNNTKDYKNDPGDNGQKNDAHVVELLSALSIIDFMNIPDNALETNKGKVEQPIYREYGLLKDVTDINFTALSTLTQDLMSKNLTSFYYFNKYINEWLFDKIIEGDNPQPYANKNEPKIDKALKTSHFYSSWLKPFNNEFMIWLEEMSTNERAFVPFYLKASLGKDINGEIFPNSGVFSKKFDFYLFDGYLNNIEKKTKYGKLEDKIIGLFYDAIDEVLTDKFNYFKSK